MKIHHAYKIYITQPVYKCIVRGNYPLKGVFSLDAGATTMTMATNIFFFRKIYIERVFSHR